jgi:hypothetical protein
MNDFAEDEKMVAKNIQYGWIHKYDKESGKKEGTFFVKNPQYDVEIQSIIERLEESMGSYQFVPKNIDQTRNESKKDIMVTLTDDHV